MARRHNRPRTPYAGAAALAPSSAPVPLAPCGPGHAVHQVLPPPDGLCGPPQLDCECNVLAGNTLNTTQTPSGLGLGIAPGDTGRIVIDAGDACRWQPKRLLLVAYRASNSQDRITNPLERLPVLLTGASVGNVSMIRRVGNLSFGIISDGYSDNKELTCVDWASFVSTNNQGLTLTIFNPNDVAVHAFADLWGRVIS